MFWILEFWIVFTGDIYYDSSPTSLRKQDSPQRSSRNSESALFLVRDKIPMLKMKIPKEPTAVFGVARNTVDDFSPGAEITVLLSRNETKSKGCGTLQAILDPL